MKFRVLASLSVLMGIATWISCSNSNSSTPSNPGVTGTGFIYVTTQGDNKLSTFTIDLPTGKVSTTSNSADTGTLPSAAIMTPANDAIFVANKVSNDISRYTIKADGTITAVTPTISVGGADSNPIALAMDGAGKFLFVLNQGPFGAVQGSSVVVYMTGASAALTQADMRGGLFGASAIAVTPDGKYLYVAQAESNTVIGYAVDANGILTPLTPETVMASPANPLGAGGKLLTNTTNPTSMVVSLDNPTPPSPNQIFLYVANANAGAGNISVFEVCDKVTIDCVTSTGEINEITGSPFVANGEPGSMVIVNPAVITPPSGTFLYVADRKLNRVLQYSIAGVTGSLTALSPASLSTGTTPLWVGARHDGQYVYTANNGSTSFSIFGMPNPTTGTLTNQGATFQATGNNPSAIVVK